MSEKKEYPCPNCGADLTFELYYVCIAQVFYTVNPADVDVFMYEVDEDIELDTGDKEYYCNNCELVLCNNESKLTELLRRIERAKEDEKV